MSCGMSELRAVESCEVLTAQEVLDEMLGDTAVGTTVVTLAQVMCPHTSHHTLRPETKHKTLSMVCPNK